VRASPRQDGERHYDTGDQERDHRGESPGLAAGGAPDASHRIRPAGQLASRVVQRLPDSLL